MQIQCILPGPDKVSSLSKDPSLITPDNGDESYLQIPIIIIISYMQCSNDFVYKLCYYLLFIVIQLCVFQEPCQIFLPFEITFNICLYNYLHHLLTRDRKQNRLPGDRGGELGLNAKSYEVAFEDEENYLKLVVLVVQKANVIRNIER